MPRQYGKVADRASPASSRRLATRRLWAKPLQEIGEGQGRVLDRTKPSEAAQAEAERRAAEATRSAEEAGRADDALPAKRPGRLRRWWQFLVTQPFSSLTHRILFLNVAGLVALVVGVLLLSQFRAGLIDARIQTLMVQADMIAGAIATSATVESDSSPITIDPDRLLRLQPGASYR